MREPQLIGSARNISVHLRRTILAPRGPVASKASEPFVPPALAKRPHTDASMLLAVSRPTQRAAASPAMRTQASADAEPGTVTAAQRQCSGYRDSNPAREKRRPATGGWTRQEARPANAARRSGIPSPVSLLVASTSARAAACVRANRCASSTLRASAGGFIASIFVNTI